MGTMFVKVVGCSVQGESVPIPHGRDHIDPSKLVLRTPTVPRLQSRLRGWTVVD